MLTPFNKSAEEVAFCRDSARAIWIRLALNRTIISENAIAVILAGKC